MAAGMATSTSTGSTDDWEERTHTDSQTGLSIIYLRPPVGYPVKEFIELSRIRINDIGSQWILREGRKFRFDAPKKVIPRQKKFNRRMMKCNRMRVTE